jgi:hypothetical protein
VKSDGFIKEKDFLFLERGAFSSELGLFFVAQFGAVAKRGGVGVMSCSTDLCFLKKSYYPNQTEKRILL